MKSRRPAVIVLALLATTGCGLTGTDPAERNGSKVNMQQAADKADTLLQETLSAVTPGLHWVHEASSDSGCPGRKNTGSVTRGISIMTVVSEQRRGALLGVIERNWKSRGFKITGVNQDKELPAIYASTPDDFRMDVVVGYAGQFHLSVATPCFTESPVAAPTPAPNTAPRQGDFPWRPDMHDPFWSATN
ncbi:hypothetical protein [Streptomyces sp. TLI_146]|uniref:hypothetical protein n=1 Tax=Streptomyces sp. TLI_146 TaxID=1938858 RepID=UPI000CCA0BEF|nr:hypothetical protein [Streptomyces sp. TLI_146]PKV86945.1 hypothetical protein BX283_4535 [Streptomyces sp. TLI_146]